jgi:hypothetical protein
VDGSKEPSFHSFYPKADVKLDLGRKEHKKECFDFTRYNTEVRLEKSVKLMSSK